jgi:hypothetical protein
MIPYKRLTKQPDYLALRYATQNGAKVSHPDFPKHNISVIDGALRFTTMPEAMMPSHGYDVFWRLRGKDIAEFEKRHAKDN